MTTDVNGNTWDAIGGLPDPLATLTLNSTEVGATTAIQDTISPVWLETFSAVIAAGSTLDVDVYDEDLTTNDFMFGCRFQPLTAATLRNFYVTCPSFAAQPAGLGSELTLWFEPQ